MLNEEMYSYIYSLCEGSLEVSKTPPPTERHLLKSGI